jgi:hypothetical protein
MKLLREYIREAIMYHSTDPANVESIQQVGLQPGRESAQTLGGTWADEFYGTRPVYLSVRKGKYEGTPFAVDTAKLNLVADLPSLVDTGAYQEEEGMYWDEGSEPAQMIDIVDEDGMVYFDELLSPGSAAAQAAIEITGTAAAIDGVPPESITLKEFRKYIRALLKEDPMGFVHDLAASDKFGDQFFGGGIGKEAGREIKRAFSKNADYQFLNSLKTVHWGTTYGIESLVGSKGKDELSATMTMPGDTFVPAAGLEVGLWIKGRITLATNDQDKMYSGFHGDYGPGSEGTEEEVAHRDKSSGRNKRPTVSKNYKNYGKLERGNEYMEKMARDGIPYILDQSTWKGSEGGWGVVNEALVDNWKPVGIIVGTANNLIGSIKAFGDIDPEDIDTVGAGVTKKIFEMAIEFKVPIYDLAQNVLWSPK